MRHKRTFFVWKYLLAVIVALLVASCGQGNGSSGALAQEETPASGTTLIDQNSAFDINTFGTTAYPGENGGELLSVITTEEISFPWVEISKLSGSWNFSEYRYLETTIKNTSPANIKVSLWAISDGGWDPVGSWVDLGPRETKTCKVDLYEQWPGGIVGKIVPENISALRFVVNRKFNSGLLEISNTRGIAHNQPLPIFNETNIPRLTLPEIRGTVPSPGQRVKDTLPQYFGTDIYHMIYLPSNWAQEVKYPIIFEFPGNMAYLETFSTGLLEDAKIGYGISQGRDYIWVVSPIINTNNDGNEIDGFGDPDATADYAEELVKHVINQYGGDHSRVLLTGWSRGAIASSYIGLTDERIADIWTAFHFAQHFDGDGWGASNLKMQ